MQTCHGCGGEYEKIRMHWGRSDCSYPSLTNRQRAIAEGLLLGDGYIPYEDRAALRLVLGNTKREFVAWVASEFDAFSASIREETESGENQNTTLYRVGITHPEFADMREKWYPDGDKQFPESVTDSVMALRLWYAGDGTLCWDKSRNGMTSYAMIRSKIHPGDLLDELPQNPWYNEKNNIVRWSSSITRDLFKSLGDPIPGFEYKWLWDDYEQYRRESDSDSKW
jgi:hypothetical protein